MSSGDLVVQIKEHQPRTLFLRTAVADAQAGGWKVELGLSGSSFMAHVYDPAGECVGIYTVSGADFAQAVLARHGVES
jgi:hypothetical protein